MKLRPRCSPTTCRSDTGPADVDPQARRLVLRTNAQIQQLNRRSRVELLVPLDATELALTIHETVNAAADWFDAYAKAL